MRINADGVDRDATETEIAEINAINLSAFDIKKDADAKEKARLAIAEKLGLTPDEIAALLS